MIGVLFLAVVGLALFWGLKRGAHRSLEREAFRAERQPQNEWSGRYAPHDRVRRRRSRSGRLR
jgi:hypothetical protein